MSKYRIVKVKNHYEVQHKGLFFWSTETEFTCDTLGWGSDIPLRFPSEAYARKYIEDQRKPKMEIICEL